LSNEEKAGAEIDALLAKAGWHVADVGDVNIGAQRCIANVTKYRSNQQ
jgi:hypothetical protein